MANDIFNDDTIYIIDSYGLIYRCYFAFISRPLTDSKGRNISALFGFFRNLRAMIEHYKPKTLIAALDSKGKTFRHEMYADYKATRPKTPEDLHAQIPWIEETLEALGVPSLRVEGYEADDVIATVTRKAVEQGKSVRILSGDKDLMQLVGERVQILKPDHADVWKVVGAEGVKAEWGVEPERLLDLLSLYGDTADNVPGVKGVGVKTACKFLDQYGSLEGIYEHADEIKGAIGQKIRDGKDSAFFSKKLITLCDTVPGDQLENVAKTEFHYAAAAQKLKAYQAFQPAKQFAALAVEAGEKVLDDGLAGQGGGDFSLASDSGAAEGSSKETVSAAASSSFSNSAEEEVPAPLPLRKNEGDYKPVTSADELKKLVDGILASPQKVVALDTETDSLKTTEAQLLGFSLSNKNGTGYYVPVSSQGDSLFASEGVGVSEAVEQISRLFKESDWTLVLHNAKFDYEVLRTAGLREDDCKAKIFDTMIAAWLLDPDKTGHSPYSLETLGQTKLALVGIEFKDLVGKGQTFRDVPLEKAVPYAAEDADFTFQLYKIFYDELKQKNLLELFETIEMPLIKILGEMELAGIHLDSAALDSYNKDLQKEISSAEKEIYKEVGHEFNIASPKQLQEVLFTERGLPHGKKTKTGYSTDTSVLEELAELDPVPAKILKYRELSKLQSTYVEALPKLADKQGRVHTSFMQTGTATGRLSSRDPNLQNIPVRSESGRKIRSAFTAVPGTVLISADYSQIELVVLAHLSGDQNMRGAFINGDDVHKATASLIYGVPADQVTPEMRRTAKTINFGVIYGMSAFRLAAQLGISRTQAQSFIENYFKQYSAINNFINNTIKGAEESGHVQTIMGRRRRVMNINSKNKVEKAAAERVAVNTPVQGSAADIVKKAMLDVSAALKEADNGARLLLQVHDELILECPDKPEIVEQTIALLRQKMEGAVKLSIPLRVSIEHGSNWGEFH
ncbi:MAG: DNA polymerase I [Treponema sp.]|nr:DNA polymerase I [Treponema sp.]